MRYDTTNLSHQKQREFMESVQGEQIEDNYYRVFYDIITDDFLLVKIDYVLKNKCNYNCID